MTWATAVRAIDPLRPGHDEIGRLRVTRINQADVQARSHPDDLDPVCGEEEVDRPPRSSPRASTAREEVLATQLAYVVPLSSTRLPAAWS